MPFAYVLTLLFAPRQACRRVDLDQHLVTMAAVLGLACVSEALATLLVVRTTLGDSSGGGFLLWTALVDLGMVCLTLLTAAVFLPFAARLMGGEGRSEEFFWPLGFSPAPWLLWGGLGLLYQMTPAALALYALTQVVLGLWIFWIQVVALSVSFRISTLRALFAAFLGYGLAAILLVLFTGVGTLSVLTTLALWIPG